jgi:hypothetical protein
VGIDEQQCSLIGPVADVRKRIAWLVPVGIALAMRFEAVLADSRWSD